MSRLVVVISLQLSILTSCLYYISGLTVGTALHCSVRREISPCTCQPAYIFRPGTKITCEGMANFTQVIHALQNQFEADHEVRLLITYSKLDDLPEFTFKQLGLSMKTLHLDHDNLSILPETVFFGLDGVEYLSLADNSLQAVPHHILKQMPLIKTLDLGYGLIGNVTNTDFQPLTQLRYLNLASNRIVHVESNCLPRTVRKLHLGHNYLADLNGTLRGLSHLEWLFLNNNNLTSIDNQFPDVIPNNKLQSLFISNNRLRNLPLELRFLQVLDVLIAGNNEIKSLDGTLAKARKLRIVDLQSNKINVLREDDFSESDAIDVLNLAFNEIQALNSSLLPLRALKQLNLTCNLLKEFSLQDIKGLRQLRLVDLSHNKISRLGGRMENLVEMETRVFELRLEHNELESLSGSLMGLTGLHRLNISHNRLESISPDDLIGLDDLHILDVSHNRLTTLEETSKTFLPSLEELIASHNVLTALERDFHGLPVLCWADLSHNRIVTMSTELAEKTQCRLHGVNSTLRIYLQGNPVLCEAKISDTITAMEIRNNTKIHGMTECLPEVTTTMATTTTTTTSTTTEQQPELIVHHQDFNSTAAMLEPQVIAAQAQPLIAAQPQNT